MIGHSGSVQLFLTVSDPAEREVERGTNTKIRLVTYVVVLCAVSSD